MKLKLCLLLSCFVLTLFTVSCTSSSTEPTLPDLSTGQDFLREGHGVSVHLNIDPEAKDGEWTAQINLHTIDQQDRLRLSISSRSSRKCSLMIKEETQTPPPSESSSNILSWDMDLEKDESLIYSVQVSNCDTMSEGLITELMVGAMMQDTTIIHDSAAIFVIGGQTRVNYYGTPWPTPTYDPLMPEIPDDYDEEVTPSWVVGTPKVTPSDVVTTLIFELTMTAYHTPTPVGTLPSPTPTPIPQTPYP